MAARSVGAARAGARWLLGGLRQDSRCAGAGLGPARRAPCEPAGSPLPTLPVPVESPPPGPAASHLQGGRSAAPSAPSRIPDPSSTHRPGGCRAGGTIAIAAAAAAASAHPGAAGAGGAERSHRAAEGAAPSTGHLGLAPRLPSHPHHLAGLLVAGAGCSPPAGLPYVGNGRPRKGAGGLVGTRRARAPTAPGDPRAWVSEGRGGAWPGLPAGPPPVFPAGARQALWTAAEHAFF